MIIYVCNHHFPDASGFGKRCEREIKALSTIDDITVLCRWKKDEPLKEVFLKKIHTVNILRFRASSQIVHRPENYKGNGLYELRRNIDMMVNLTLQLVKTLWKYRKQSIQLYCVNSPLTASLVVLLIGKLTRTEPRLISFHDLEPELAMHMKNLDKRHWLVRLEFFLESIICRGFNKVLVTSHGQAEKLLSRTRIPKSKVCVIPNTTDIRSLLNKDHSHPALPFSKQDFVLTYMSTLSFDYTISGLKKFLQIIPRSRKSFPNLKVAIIGGGVGLHLIQSVIVENQLQDVVVATGPVKNPAPLLKLTDAAFIPWEKDAMTETILPTKLIEFLSLGLPIIAPKFGEFKRILEHKKTALLYQSVSDIFPQIKLLMKDKKISSTLSNNSRLLFDSVYLPEVLNEKFINFYL